MAAPVAVRPDQYDPYSADRDAWAEQACCAEACTTIAVFGATGDLAKKKTFPSLAALYARGFLPKSCSIIGYGRSEYTDQGLRDKLKGGLPGDEAAKETFLQHVTYHRGDYDNQEGFSSLQGKMQEKEARSNGTEQGRLFYLALPPSVYPQVLANVHAACTSFASADGDTNRWVRVIVEKPFGKDLESSEELSDKIGRLFSEDQIYRIDHFLGKEMAQNILNVRFNNMVMSAIWNRASIDNIQISMKEAFGTQGRGGYFDEFGIIRDVIQNHLLQILALVTMERPSSMHPDDIRDEKTKLIRSIRVLGPKDAVLGQYTAGQGEPGYTDDAGVPAGSQTPTYAVVRMAVDNERWDGVPMIIKAGKALNETKTEIRVQFKSMPGFFGDGAAGMRNEFVMVLKPQDAMYLKMVMKKPGLGMDMEMSELNLTYKERFDAYIPDAYERLILDAVNGNQAHFVRRDELRASWAVFNPLLHAIDQGAGPEVHKYEFGSRGVEAGDQLIAEAGFIRSTNYSWKTT